MKKLLIKLLCRIIKTYSDYAAVVGCVDRGILSSVLYLEHGAPVDMLRMIEYDGKTYVISQITSDLNDGTMSLRITAVRKERP